MPTVLINLISSPGAGKTTAAALIFAHLKVAGHVVEYVPEYAKQLIWAKDFETLDNQYFVSSQQYKLFKAVDGQVEYIVTDTSLMSGIWYNINNPNNNSNVEKTEKYIVDRFKEFNNFNIFLERGDFKYEQAGRQQNEQESKIIHQDLKQIMDQYKVEYTTVKLNGLNVKPVVDLILEKTRHIVTKK